MQLSKRHFALFSTIAITAGCSSTLNLENQHSKLAMESYISSYGSKLGKAWAFKGEAYVLKEGRPLFHVNTESNKPENYLIGSITKSLTAVTILKLADEYQIDVDAPIGDYWTTLPEKFKPLTVTQLLSHTSGLGDIPSLYQENASSEPQEVFKSIAASPIYFEPGSYYQYSNAAYYLLGLFIEEVSGKPWLEYMAESVLTPAGLDSIGFSSPSVMGWTRFDNHLKPSSEPSVDIGQAAGALRSSSSDLTKFAYQLTQSDIVTPQQFEYLTMDHVGITEVQHGAGFSIQDIAGIKTVGHGGKIQGFTSQLQFDLGGKCIAVVLSNNERFSASKVAKDLTEICLTGESVPPAQEPTIVAPSDALVKSIEGSYTLSPLPQEAVYLIGEELVNQISKISLAPKGKGIELSNDAGAQPPALLLVTDTNELIEFDHGISIKSQDDFESFILSQGGLAVEYKKNENLK